MEKDVGAATDRFVAVDCARGDDADGRFVLFHHAELGVRRMGAKEHVFGDVKGVLHIAGRVVRREVQSFIVVVVAIDVRTVLNGEAHPCEDLDDLAHHLMERMFSSEITAAARQRNVDLFLTQPFGEFCFRKALKSLLAEVRDLFFEDIDLLANDRTLVCGSVAKMLHQVLDGTFFAKIFDLELFHFFAVLDGREFGLKLFA